MSFCSRYLSVLSLSTPLAWTIRISFDRSMQNWPKAISSFSVEACLTLSKNWSSFLRLCALTCSKTLSNVLSQLWGVRHVIHACSNVQLWRHDESENHEDIALHDVEGNPRFRPTQTLMFSQNWNQTQYHLWTLKSMRVPKQFLILKTTTLTCPLTDLTTILKIITNVPLDHHPKSIKLPLTMPPTIQTFESCKFTKTSYRSTYPCKCVCYQTRTATNKRQQTKQPYCQHWWNAAQWNWSHWQWVQMLSKLTRAPLSGSNLLSEWFAQLTIRGHHE